MSNPSSFERRYWLPIATIFGILLMLLFAALKPKPGVQPHASIAPLVEIYEVKTQPLAPLISGFGRVIPHESWAAISEVTGRVIYRHPELEQGRSLPSETIVIKIDPVDYELALAQSRSNLKTAELELQRIKLNQKSYTQSREIEKSRLDIAKSELNRKQNLNKNKLISNSELESQRNAVLAQQKTVWDLESKLDLIPTDLEVAQANLNVALAQQNSAQRSLDRTQISLPFSGQIGNVNVELGQVVNLQQTLLQADDLRIMEVTANMSLSDMRRLISATSGDPRANGQAIPDIRNLPLTAKVLLTVGDQQYTWPAKVDRIDGSIDVDANTIGMTVQVTNQVQDFDPRLSPPLVKDMYVQVQVSSIGKEALVIPSKALHGKHVYILNDDKTLTIREVHVSYQQDDKSAIGEGLEQGERIIVTDILAPSNGMQVRLLDTDKKEAKP